METKRVALVIGNSAYSQIRKLNNADRDAIEIGKKLTALEFEVRVAVDLKFNDMEKALNLFYERAPGAVALLYFAGHGVQSAERSNFLLPVDAELSPGLDIANQGFDLSKILGGMTSKAETSLLFIDACRDRGDNPAESNTRRVGGGPDSQPRGLAPVQEFRGVFVGFSTALNGVADDGPAGGLSPFAKALCEHIETVSLSIDDLMQKVAYDVAITTQGRQAPFKHSGLTKPFYFRDRGGPGPEPRPDLDPDKKMVEELSQSMRSRLEKIKANVEIALATEDRVLVEMADRYVLYMEYLVQHFPTGEFPSPRVPRPQSPKNSYSTTLAQLYARARRSVFSTSRTEFGLTWKDSGEEIIGAHVNANVPVHRVFLIDGDPAPHIKGLREYRNLCRDRDVNRVIHSSVFVNTGEKMGEDKGLNLSHDYTIIDDGRFVGISTFSGREVSAIWYHRSPLWSSQARDLQEFYRKSATDLDAFLAEWEAKAHGD